MPRSSAAFPDAPFQPEARASGGGVFALWIVPLILSTFSVVIISSMTGWNLSSPGFKQAVWLLVALAAFLFVTQISLKFWFRSSRYRFFLALLLMALTITPLGVSVKGASRWLRFGPVNFQPLELVSFVLMLHISKVYACEKGMWRALVLTAAIFLPFAVIIMKQPDFGGLLMVGALLGALFVERYGFFIPVLGSVILAPFLWYLATRGYRMERIATWIDPWLDPMGAGYQVIQGLIAFANGNVWGIGMGRGQGFLPEIHNDFIFPAIGEQFGLVGTMAVFLLFLFWTVCVFARYRGAPTERRLLIWGCCVSVLLPFFINLGGVMKVIPLTGMPLPFVSYGGTSLVMMWARIGLLIRLIKEQEQ